jgi:type I restriction enzyme S subunit
MIDSLLEYLNQAREELCRVPMIMKRFRQTVLASACSGRITEDWRSLPASESAQSETKVASLCEPYALPDIPDTWTWTTIGALAAPEKNSITDGPFGSNLKTEHYTESGPRVIRLQNISDYRFIDLEAHISADHFNTLSKHQIQAGDVAIACLGDPVPRACVIPESIGPAIVKADCIRFKPDATLTNTNYICYVLNDSATRSRMSEIVHGVGRSRLNLQQIKSIPVPLPPLSEQLEIVRRVETLLCLGEDVERQVAFAAKRNKSLAQSILAKAFRGELVPTEAELARREGREYEPASVLLERIKSQQDSPVEAKSKSPKRMRKG